MSGMRPFMSLNTCWAVVGLGLPDRFALGAAIGTPQARINALAHSFSGKRTPTLSRPAVQTSDILSPLGRIMVSGPGQKASASFCACKGMSPLMTFRISSIQAICTIRGLSWGRPFAAKIFRIASGSQALAPRPYTVSVGKATTSPFLISSAARESVSEVGFSGVCVF